jgi:hypothetical protein
MVAFYGGVKMLRKDFDVEVMAWQIIDDKDFDTLVDVLIELKAYRETTCEYCGGPIGDEEIMHRKCPEDPWCECGRSEPRGSCMVCDHEDV